MQAKNTKLRLMTEGALMIALATLLSFYPKLMDLPYGGSVTLEMIPLVVMSYRHGVKWGTFTAFVHSVLQLILGFSNVMYCTTLLRQFGCIMLDYIVAFSIIGTACWCAGLFKNRVIGSGFGAFVVCCIRFVCHFITGIWLWGGYAPEGMSAAYYSLVYNGSYMLFDTIITVAAAVLLVKYAPKLFEKA